MEYEGNEKIESQASVVCLESFLVVSAEIIKYYFITLSPMLISSKGLKKATFFVEELYGWCKVKFRMVYVSLL